MKRLTNFLLVISFLSGVLMFEGCKKKPELSTLNTSPVSDITLVSAKSGGEITDDGNADITERGVVWGTNQEPTINGNKTSDGSGPGSFDSQLSGLSEGTTYYVRAYATNSVGTSYGNEESFTTVPAGQASVTTRSVSDVTFTTAVTGGDIASDGGAPVTAKGICWNTAENPTITNNVTNEGTGNDGFTSNLVSLAHGTTYYVRAYATNKSGTSYGNQVTFSTPAMKAPGLTTAPVANVSVDGGVSGGIITADGGSPVSTSGIVWNTSPNPTIENNKTTDGTTTGTFASNMSGLAPGTVYYVRAYATNSIGTTYGNEIVFSTSITDVDGNVYKTVPIGNQVWMAENLKTTHFRDNSYIPYITDSLVWSTLTTPGYSWYRHQAARRDQFGGIYNWFTVQTGNLCPQGWHVPTQSEFKTMEQQIGVPADSLSYWGWRGAGKGTALKSTSGWDSLGNGNNQTGMNILPSGYRAWVNGQFRGVGFITYIWTSTDDAINHKPTVAWYRRIDATDTRIYNATTEKGSGKSIRCMKNQ